MDKVQLYVTLLQDAVQISETLVHLIKNFALHDLSPSDYLALDAAWQADLAESAKNAGLP